MHEQGQEQEQEHVEEYLLKHLQEHVLDTVTNLLPRLLVVLPGLYDGSPDLDTRGPRLLDHNLGNIDIGHRKTRIIAKIL